MKIPKGMTEEQVLETIENVAQRLAYKFKFGYHEVEDMKQQAKIFALEVLPKYDNKRPLENFLWSCVHNKLFNFKRDNFERPGYPCKTCPYNAWEEKDDSCKKYGDKLECKYYGVWFKRNSSKRNVMHPIDLSNVEDEHEKNMKTDFDVLGFLDAKELDVMIEKHLSVELRTDYIKLKNNINISKKHKAILIDAIKEIVSKEY